MLFLFSAITIGILVIGFLLGIKHSLDADHVAAVSSILVKSPKFGKTVKLSMLWALGHTITAGIITIILFLIKDIILDKFLSGFEIIVAFMLIFIGTITLLWESNVIKKDKLSGGQLNGTSIESKTGYSLSTNKDHGIIGPKTNHFLGFKKKTNAITAIGIIQGLASNDELLLLLTFTLGLDNLYIILLGLVLFSVGVMIGMIIWSSIIKLPGLRKKQERLLKMLNIIIALITIAYGFYILLGGEGINLLPMIGE